MRNTLTIILSAVAMVWSTPLTAQEPSPPDAAPSDIRIYQPKHLTVGEAARILSDVFADTATFIADDRKGTLIVRAPGPEFDEIGSVLNALDVPHTGGESEPLVYHCTHIEPHTLAQVLRETLGMRVTSVDGTNLIVVPASGEVERAKGLLSRLDVPPVEDTEPSTPAATLGITFHFLSATLGAGNAEGTPLPPNLAEVGKALTAEGLNGLKVMAHIKSRVEQNEPFSSQGNFETGEGNVGQVRIEGEVSAEGRNNAALLSIEAELVMGPSGNPSREALSIETTTAVPFGDYVVVGAVPTSVQPSGTVVMVIQIKPE